MSSSPTARELLGIGTDTCPAATPVDQQLEPSPISIHDATRSQQESGDQGSNLGSTGTGAVKEIISQSQRVVVAEIRSITAPLQSSVQVLHDAITEQSKKLDKLAESTNALLLSSPLVSSKGVSVESAAQAITVEAFVGQEFMRRISVANYVVFFTRMFTNSPEDSGTAQGERANGLGSTSDGVVSVRRKKRKTRPYVPKGPIDPIRVLRAMMFAPDAASRKRARQLGPGKDFIELRVQMLASMVASAERLHPDGVPTRSVQGNVDKKEKGSDRRGEDIQFHRPAWAMKGAITRNHVERWRAKYLASVSEDPSKQVPNGRCRAGSVEGKTSQPSRKRAKLCESSVDEAAKEVLKRLWTMQTDFLSRAREYSRPNFLQHFGFLFMPCNVSVSSEDKRDLIKSIDKIPAASVPSTADDKTLCIKKNSKTVEAILASFPELDLVCRYDVRVLPNRDDLNTGTGATFKTMTTVCNVFAIASEFLVSYHQLSDAEELFLAHPNSFKYIFCISAAFKTITMNALDKLSNEMSVEDVAAEAVDIGVVPPGQDVRSKLVSSEVLTLVQSQFDEKNQTMQEAFQTKKPERGHIEEDGGYSSDDDDVIIVS